VTQCLAIAVRVLEADVLERNRSERVAQRATCAVSRWTAKIPWYTARKEVSLRFLLPRVVPAVALLTALTSCTGDRGMPAALGPVEPLSSPAAAASGEPFMTATRDGRVLLSWLEQQPDTSVSLRFAAWDGNAWSEPRTIVTRRDFFVNWADFPSILELPDGRLATHWLQREGAGTYAYGIRIATSADGGASWSEPLAPHTDNTLTEHGFVSLFADGEDLGAIWLDGRNMGGGHGHGGGDMTIRFARLGSAGTRMDEAEIDARTCECCQTDAALTDEGPIVAYRDRSPDEVRNIVVSRRVAGDWTEPAPVHDDAWTIPGCPVNGPAIVAAGRDVAVAWFSAPDDVAQVKVVFSTDAGVTFGAPVRIDDGDPAGRVDLLSLDDGVLVSWIERTSTGAAVRVKRVTKDGRAGAALDVATASAERASGFPRMARSGDGILFAWTEPGQPAHVRMARAAISP
jgi:hypothetical protein